MSNAWEQAEGLAEQHSNAGSGLFVSLKNDGDKVVGAFVGEPLPREVHWAGERYEECTRNASCRHCGEGKRPTLRVAMNFFVRAEGEMKIIEGGVSWFKDLVKARNKYGLGKWFFEIERHGAAGNPKTTYTILPDAQITDADTEQIAALALHDLAVAVRGDGEASGSADGKRGGRSIDVRVSSQFVARLKALPRDAVEVFLKKFGVQRIRDLKESQEDAARAFIDHLEGQREAGNSTGTQEVDPFA